MHLARYLGYGLGSGLIGSAFMLNPDVSFPSAAWMTLAVYGIFVLTDIAYSLRMISYR